ncbi:PH domain-containing protein [Phytohabitans sp. LJ34]|uniref:PH domain-containing protein n=1 Tax=Phytohabitans sp. LJ34 TaxID=3452217 RepID=UPI003F8C5D32
MLRTVIRYETAMWRGLFRWLTRRPVQLAPGDVAFGHAGPVKPIFAVFIVLSALEIPIFDLVISRLVPWSTVRYAALVAGVYGLIWMIGALGALLTNPHVVGDAGIRLRNGTSIDITIPWDAIASVRHRYRSLPSSRGVQVEGTVLHLGTGGQTSIDVTLREPLTLPVHEDPVDEVRFYADDPNALVALARTLA